MDIEKAIGILRHSLGLDNAEQSYRNYYAAGPDDAEVLQLLVARGWMFRGEDRGGGLFFYHCTASGIAVAEEKTEKPCRKAVGQARYQQFLEAADAFPDLTFKEFLTHPYFSRARA